MTPERIEEIKRDAQEEAETIYRNCTSNISNIELLGLLAALEEAQQQQTYAKERGITWSEEVMKLRDDLAEAQQTIARQQKTWQELKDIVSTNATGGKGEDVNDYDIMLNIIGDLEGEKTDEGHDNA